MDLTKWLSYANIEHALPRISFTFDNKDSVIILLKKIQKEIFKLGESKEFSKISLPDVDPENDYLLIEDRIEILIPSYGLYYLTVVST